MRIGIFTDTYLPYVSGLVTSELMLKKALEKMGHEVFVVTANLETFKYENDPENKIIRISGVPIGIYDARLTGIYSINAISEIKKWKLDVIHSQTEFGIGTFARIVSKQLNIPIVHTYHTLYEDYVYYITKGHFDKTSKKIVEYLTKFYCDTTVTELIVPSRKIYNIFTDKYKVSRNINIIGTGMDNERFYIENIDIKRVKDLKKKYKIKESDFVIGTVCRVAKEKSVDKMIITFEEISKNIDNSKLLIVGDGPDKEYLENLVKELKLTDKVIFTGKVPIEQIQEYYRLMNIFVTFSITETQGLTVLEAMASSLPILAIKDDSFVDAVENNKNGILFNTDEEYINYVYKLYNDKKLYEKECNYSKELSKKHSSEEFAKSVYKVYLSAIKNSESKKVSSIKNVFKGIKIQEKSTKNEDK